MIDFNQVLYADRHAFMERKSVPYKINILSAIKALFFTRIKLPDKKTCQYLFFRSLVRDDYKTLFNSVASVVPDAKRLVIEDYTRTEKYPDFRAIAVLFRQIPNLYSFSADSFYQRICLYIRLCFYCRQVLEIEKIDFKAIVLFSDMQPVENLISQYFNVKGKITITMQHGLYVDYGDYQTVNRINYLHQPSEYFLSWGANTRRLIQKYHPGRKVILCGKPGINLYKKNRSKPTDDKYFTVILDQKIFVRENSLMLSLMGEYSKLSGVKMNLRFHPKDDGKEYRGINIDYVQDYCVEHSEFVVGHTSSLIYELLFCGMPTFKYASDIPFVALPDELIFSSVTELQACLDNEIDFKKIGSHYIDSSGQDSLCAYSHFFTKLDLAGLA